MLVFKPIAIPRIVVAPGRKVCGNRAILKANPRDNIVVRKRKVLYFEGGILCGLDIGFPKTPAIVIDNPHILAQPLFDLGCLEPRVGVFIVKCGVGLFLYAQLVCR